VKTDAEIVKAWFETHTPGEYPGEPGYQEFLDAYARLVLGTP